MQVRSLDIDKQLINAINNLSSISNRMIPKASAMAINRVATRAIGRSVKAVAKDVGIKQKVVRNRVSVTKRATEKEPFFKAKVRQYGVSARHFPSAVRQVKQNARRYKSALNRQSKRKRPSKNPIGKFSTIRVNGYIDHNVFMQKLPNGFVHIVQRMGDERLPINVIRYPIKDKVEENFTKISTEVVQSDMRKELSYAMAQQLRLHIRNQAGKLN